LKEIDESIREKLGKGQVSPFKTYIGLTVGQVGLSRFVVYEILTSLLGPMPGGIGFYLRKKFYPRLFKKAGTGLIIGRNVVIRHPQKIELGNNVTIDDNCVIDGRGAGPEGLVLEDNVIINRNCMILAKSGPIRLGKRTSIGSNSVIVSMDGVELGEAVLMAGGCSISAGSYHFEDIDAPVMDQGAYSKGAIRIEAKSWLGTGVIVLDGVTIKQGAVIGAGAVVVKDIPKNAVAVGVPARVVKVREKFSKQA
jgi:acetyltransferase-like isoleucine patch superfamily enzyme